MRSLCLTGAVVVILVINGSALWHAVRNRAQFLGGTLQLTERELPRQPVGMESSVTMLRFSWTTDRLNNERFGPVAWLGTNKLAELGFDLNVPLGSPCAPRHYDAMPARRVFLALENQAPAVGAGAEPPASKTWLTIIDAAQQAQVLRQRYPNVATHAICRGTVRLALQRQDPDGAILNPPRLVGWVEGLAPAAIVVSRPVNRSLTTLLRTTPEAEDLARPPRFSARVHWGREFEPWIDEIRQLGTSPVDPVRRSGGDAAR